MKTRQDEIEAFWKWLDNLEHDFSREPEWVKGSRVNRGTVISERSGRMGKPLNSRRTVRIGKRQRTAFA